MTNAAEVLWRQADERPDAIALRDTDLSWTYDEVRQRTAAFGERLIQSGVSAGDRVLVVVPTVAEFVFSYHGILAVGAVAVTINTLSTKPELDYFIADSGCTLVVVWHETAAASQAAAEAAGIPCWTISPTDFASVETQLRTPVERADDDAAVLLYTSGTTGRAKGALLTHANLAVAAQTFCAAFGLEGVERFGTALPLFHVFGQVAVLGCAFHSGSSVSLLRPFSGAGLLKMAADHRLTVLSGVPTMWTEMLFATTDVTREDLGELRLASSGGAALPLAIARKFSDRFGATVLDGYGLSETAAAATANYPGMEPKEGSVGRALPGLTICLFDEVGNEVPPGTTGEVAISGAVVMRGYWGNPEATDAAFRGEWLLTGDLGRMDADGYLWIVDRKKDLVIRGGYNVYPREIEEVLYQHPAIQEAAVVGIPDDRLGQEVAAVIALRAGQSLDVTELRPWLAEQLAAYKIPRLYQLVEELPKGATGKILKRAIDLDDVADSAHRVRHYPLSKS